MGRKCKKDIPMLSVKNSKNYYLQPSSFSGLFFALLLGYIFLSLSMPEGFIQGTSSYWCSQHDDITQYIAGFNAYFSENWHFPLWTIEAFNYPIGTRSTFVDIIPLYAFFLKLFVPASAFPFNPFGYWVGFCFMAQAFAAWLILKELKNNSWAVLLTLTLFLLFFPALLARIGHISLMSHFIILMAFVLYIRSATNPFQPLGWTVLLSLAFYTNIYLFTMALTIFFATLLGSLKTLPLKNQLIQFLIPLFILFASSWLTIFPLPKGGFAQDFGWGYYSMNLLAPFHGSAFFKIPNAEMPGQYEGFNYLGLGVLLLFVYALYLQRQKERDFWKKHRYIVLALTLFTLYAFSSRIYLGSFKLISFSYPHFMDTLVHQFRASGRFFWPVGYAIMIFSVLMVAKHGNKYKYIVLILALFLQIADLKERYALFKQTLHRDSPVSINEQQWRATIPHLTQHLYFYPKFRCSKLPPHASLLPTMLFASQNRMTLNTGYIARYQPDCNDIALEISRSDLAHSGYIFVKEEFSYEQMLSFFPQHSNITCKPLDFAWLCSKNFNGDLK